MISNHIIPPAVVNIIPSVNPLIQMIVIQRLIIEVDDSSTIYATSFFFVLVLNKPKINGINGFSET